MKIFTIGFTQKSAEVFFNLLVNAGVKKILDVRLNNGSQLAGFAKGRDLKYFAKKIGDIEYEHNIDLAPTSEILKGYKDKKITWGEYVENYQKILDNRKVLKKIDVNNLDMNCLLCSEHEADFCHRRLLAEYLKKHYSDLEIVHLVK